MRLKDKLAVITAAASGMGRAGVELFAREGATVAAVDINAAALKTVASDANAKGGKVIPIVSDLSPADGVRQSVADAATVLGAAEVVQHMRLRGGGSLVFTASVSGMVGSMFSPVYSPGKFAVVGLTK